MRPLYCAFGATAIAVACCACYVAVLKHVFRNECIDGRHVSPSGSILRPTITSLLVAAVLASGMATACLVTLLSKRAKAVALAVCSNWQALYFIVVSVQKIVLRAIVIPYALASISKGGITCLLPADLENQLDAGMFMWDSAVLLLGAAVICADMDAAFTASLRRCAQCLLTLCLSADAVGSIVWGNEMAGAVSLDVSWFEFQIGNLITSCIISQVVLALHFAFIGWRSRHGRSWFYAPLRFELDQRGIVRQSRLTEPCVPTTTKTISAEQQRIEDVSSSIAEPVSETDAAPSGLQSEAAAMFDASSAAPSHVSRVIAAFRRARKRFKKFQNKHLSQCRVFVIPWDLVSEGDGNAEFVLRRPAFNLVFLRPLQRVADTHPKFYCIFVFVFLIVPVIACLMFLRAQSRGVSTLCLAIPIFLFFLGFLSSKRYNLDLIAVQQVALSFRFAIFVVLLSQWIALSVRQAAIYSALQTPWDVAAETFIAIVFSLCLLLDCSPHLPATVQIVLTAGWTTYFAFQCVKIIEFLSYGKNPDCFWNLGAYQVCDVTQQFSVYSNLFLLMTQALLSRILVPGMSNFVNASILHHSVLVRDPGDVNGAPMSDDDTIDNSMPISEDEEISMPSLLPG